MTRRPAPAAAAAPTPEFADAEFENELIRRRRSGMTKPILLHGWFAHDTWTRDEGLLLLLGLLPGPFERSSLFRLALDDVGPTRTQTIISARFLDWSLVDLQGYLNARRWLAAEPELDASEFPITSFELVELGATLQRYEDLWDSGEHRPRNPPAYFLKWAARKGINVPWTDWATGEGLAGATRVPRRSIESPAEPELVPVDEAEAFQELRSDEDGASAVPTLNDSRWARARASRAWAVARAAELTLETTPNGKHKYPSRAKLAEKIQQELVDDDYVYAVDTVKGWLKKAAQ